MRQVRLRSLIVALGLGVLLPSGFGLQGAAAQPADEDELVWHGQVRNGRPYSPSQDLPPLQAPPGVTALAGQVLRLNGAPLPNVTLQIGGVTTQTDQTGRFLLVGIPAGHQEMLIDGRAAGTPGLTYGVYEVGVDITAGQTNVLPWTSWQRRIDTQHGVTIPSPTIQETVITTPLIPGLELRIPTNSVIKDHQGQVATQISLTQIPVDRPPFPLATNIEVPIYFTIQPGAGYVENPNGAKARVIYPNLTGFPPGARFNFWHYDAGPSGWYIYGLGTVTPNAQQIVPDPDIGIYEFTGAMINGAGVPPCSNDLNVSVESANCSNPDWFGVAEPVDPATGLFILDKTDLVVQDVIPIVLTRTYRPGDPNPRPFGIGSTHPYAMFLWSYLQFQQADLVLPSGARVHYVRTSPGTGYSDAIFEHTTSPTRFYKSVITWNGHGWDLRLKDGTVYVMGENAPIQAIRDRSGNTLKITHDNGTTGNVAMVTSPNGRWIQFTYETYTYYGDKRIIQVQDNLGRTVGYQYDALNRLWKVTDPAGGVTEYTYDTSNRLLTIKDARGIVFLTNQYDANGRVTLQTQADQTTYQLAYTLDGNGQVTQTDLTDPRGNVRRLAFDASRRAVTDTRALGLTEQQTTSYVRQAGSEFVTSSTDALSRQTTYTYDAMGNVLTVTRPGPSGNVTWTYTYEPTWNQVQTIKDPLNYTTTFGYDGAGNLTTITDPRSKVTTLTYDSQGRPLTVKDPLNHTWTLTYDGPDLATIKNPLNQTTTRYSDSVGRLVSLKDPLGNQTRYAWDALNRLTGITDALSGLTQFGYDANGNLLSLQDARGNQTQYSPDSMDRVQTRTDALLHGESSTYDPNGNLLTFTDRKSQQRTLTYDALDRVTRVDYADASFTTYTWDAGNRLTQITDSITGTITRTPDILDRLTQEVTPQGTVSWGYDNANRRTSMTVLGQTALSYTYDNADRLTNITQGTASVTIGYDDANRRTSLTLPNTVQATYGYDTSNRLTSITFKKGATTLGTLTYTYDAAGRRTAITGTWARTGIPAAVASAAYNANNQQTAWGGQTNTFDLNGNLTSDGTNTYTWDARDRLASISGGTTASFQYDPTGRRASKTIAGTTTQFLYDGANPVQELSGGGAVLANLLTGLGIDEYFTRTDGSGRRTLLADALGSILALTDDAGTVQTSYTYEPFGNASVSGQANANSFQYTGRENDGAGSYYYRTRYYHPIRQRFLSEDPIRFRGGDFDLYAYVLNSPTNRRDPNGLAAAGCLIGPGVPLGSIGLGGRKDTLLGFIGYVALVRDDSGEPDDNNGKPRCIYSSRYWKCMAGCSALLYPTLLVLCSFCAATPNPPACAVVCAGAMAFATFVLCDNFCADVTKCR